ncbi:MAG: mannose-1-phosphate guanylyltransferase [Simkaniaceae bacterium]|nr:mannose-1-phosphate guanylyltransferase [Simkaniaceae bacterium]
MKIIILAGGRGTRLWPLSTKNSPKQFLRINSEDSFLQQTLKRFKKAGLVHQILISTSKEFSHLAKEQAKTVAPQLADQVLIEPCNRGTAGSVAFAVKHMMENLGCEETETFLVCPSDHYFKDEMELIDALSDAKSIAEEGKIVLFGKTPSSPETGYGYVKVGSPISKRVFEVDKFVEKPDEEKANYFINEGDYLWNLGTFVFQIRHFLKELAVHAAAIYQWFQKDFKTCQLAYQTLPNISIDYALMEKSTEIALITIDTFWSDIGSWDNIYALLEKDDHQNVKLGNVVDIETKNCLLVSQKKMIATIGVEDLLIVETKEAIIIAKRGESQKVKKIVDELSEAAGK